MQSITAIAMTAWRELLRQPAIWVISGIVFVMILMFRYFTFFALGEERTMIREMALASMTLAGILVVVLGASTVLSEEGERKTLSTILSKPVRRGEILAGKFVGIALSALVVFVPLTLVYVGAVCWSQLEMGRAALPVGLQVRHFLLGGAAGTLLKASALAWVGVLVLAAVSVAVSIRVPMLVNIAVTLGVFALGHQADSILALLYPKDASGNLMVEAVDAMGWWQIFVQYPQVFLGRVLYGLVPPMEAFDAGEAVAVGAPISSWYVLIAFGHAALYIGFALAIAVILFEKREFV